MNDSLDNVRKLVTYALGKTSLAANDLPSAYDQFYRLYLEDRHYEDVADLCVEVALKIAEQAFRRQHWRDAISWWEKTLVLSPSQKGELQRRIRSVRTRAWLDYHRSEIVVVTVLLAILACLSSTLAMWQPWQRTGVSFATDTPTLTMSVLSPTYTSTVTPSPTFTGALSSTPTPSSTPTATATSTSTHTQHLAVHLYRPQHDRSQQQTMVAPVVQPELLEPSQGGRFWKCCDFQMEGITIW